MPFATFALFCIALVLGFSTREAVEYLRARSVRLNRYIRYIQVHYLPRRKPKRLSILGLPGELRNSIYRYVLVPNEPTRIDRTNYAQPALLRSCTRIRREAMPLYYQENKFVYDCADHDFSAYINFCKHGTTTRGMTAGNSAVELGGGRNSWAGLKKGAKEVHERRAGEISYVGNFGGRMAAATGAFAMVAKLKGTP